MSDDALRSVPLDTAREAPEQLTAHVRGGGTELTATTACSVGMYTNSGERQV
ncbi:hypothetical protein [Streptomyces sp. NPDC001744]|uniref:hypothetical protein n=1 Tax=Streptomyces sp. NPDC001744 TaxID=3364606 RepID=UPI0036A55E75